MNNRVLSVLCLILGGCTVTPSAPTVEADKTCAYDAKGAAPGEWLIGRWTHPYSTLDIRRQGAGIVYQWERSAGLVSPTWGVKGAASGSGTVTRISGCSIEMYGRYDSGETGQIVGSELIHRMTLVSPDLMRGQWIGAGRMWFDVSWRRDLQAVR